MQIPSFTFGYKNPSLSSIIVIHCFGHAEAHALHPQQWALSKINIILFDVQSIRV